MELLRNTIPIGLEKPLKILHVTDSHIALADGYLAEQIAYAKENCDGAYRRYV